MGLKGTMRLKGTGDRGAEGDLDRGRAEGDRAEGDRRPCD